jgi:hypothetical protein
MVPKIHNSNVNPIVMWSERVPDFNTLPQRGKSLVRLEVFIAVPVKIVDSWDVNAVSTGKWFPTLAVNLPVFTFREL